MSGPANHQSDNLREAAARVSAAWPIQPKAGIVLGSGLGSLAQHVVTQAEFDLAELPGFPAATALGHRGRLICGTLAGVPVVAFQGRYHLYEGHPAAVAALPALLTAELGASALIVSNAAGGVRPTFRVGDLMLIDDHINLQFRTPISAEQRSLPCYDAELSGLALEHARQAGARLHRGVYVAMLGPTYETRAEYRLVRTLGGDAAGMSTVPEVLAARAAGLRVLGFSVITNVGFPDAIDSTSGHDVINVANRASAQLGQIVRGVLRQAFA